MLTSCVTSWRHYFLCNKKMMKIANIDREILQIFWKTWWISIKFSGKIWPIIILKVTKNQGFTLSLEDTFFERPQEENQIDCPPPAIPIAVLELILLPHCNKISRPYLFSVLNYWTWAKATPQNWFSGQIHLKFELL